MFGASVGQRSGSSKGSTAKKDCSTQQCTQDHGASSNAHTQFAVPFPSRTFTLSERHGANFKHLRYDPSFLVRP